MTPANPDLRATSLNSVASPVPSRFLGRLQLLTHLSLPAGLAIPADYHPSSQPQFGNTHGTKPLTLRANGRGIMRSCRSDTQELSTQSRPGLWRAAVSRGVASRDRARLRTDGISAGPLPWKPGPTP
jgi:hypothetical protein